MSYEIDPIDELNVKGVPLKREPSEGWTFVFLTNPETPPMHLREQPEPKAQCQFHRAEAPDADPIIFTLFGRDDQERVAYFVKGSWAFDAPPTAIFDDEEDQPNG